MPTTQFPARYREHAQRIRVLCASDCAFSELWKDYCEVLDLVTAATPADKGLEQVRGELEKDIDDALGKQT